MLKGDLVSVTVFCSAAKTLYKRICRLTCATNFVDNNNIIESILFGSTFIQNCWEMSKCYVFCCVWETYETITIRRKEENKLSGEIRVM